MNCKRLGHSTESNSDSGHGTVEQNWYTFRQSHINVLCSIQREEFENNNFMKGE